MTLRYMPTTSVYDRELALRQPSERGDLLNLSERTLYLMCGEDRTDGRNDYRVRS